MNLDDFRWMWKGYVVKSPTEADADLMKPYQWQSASQGKALLLLHGFSSSPAVFRALYPALETNYQMIYCPQLPGHGQSIQAFQECHAEEWVATAIKAYEDLQQHYTTIDVLGLSLGGILACELAKIFPIHHLYLLAPALDLQLPISLTLKLVQALQALGFTSLRNKAGDILAPNHCELSYRKLPLRSVETILNFIHNFQFELPLCPTDLFLGKYDAVVHSETVAKRFSNHTQTEIHWLNQSAHVLPLDHDLPYLMKIIQSQTKVSTPNF